MSLYEGNVLFQIVVVGAIVALVLTGVLSAFLVLRKSLLRSSDAYIAREECLLSPLITGVILTDGAVDGTGPDADWHATVRPEMEIIGKMLVGGSPLRREWNRRAAWKVLRQLTSDLSGEALGRTCTVCHDLGFFDAAMKLLKDRRWWKRTQGCRMLASMKDRKAMYPLVQLLEDRNADVRVEAAQALISIVGGAEAIGPILSRVKSVSRWLKITLSEAVQESGSSVVPHLLAALDSPYPPVREFCIQMLGELKDPEAVEALLPRLDSLAGSERAAAITTLASIGDSRAFTVILEASKDDNPLIRRAGIHGLGIFGSPEAIDPLSRFVRAGGVDERILAAEALGGLGPEGAARLHLIGKDEDESTRVIALHVLDLMQDSGADVAYEGAGHSGETV